MTDADLPSSCVIEFASPQVSMSKWTRQKGIAKSHKPANMIARRYSIPAWAVDEIKKAGDIYGSQGRALLAATEILIRMMDPPAPEPTQPETLMTLRLHARTAELIETLSKSRYENRAQVFAACIKVLKMKRIRI
jgi:hypothetical protein